MLRSPHDRDIWRIALPALGALAADPLVSLIDTAFVSWLGPVPLAAMGVDAALFSLAFVVFNFLAYGTTPLIADALARGDRRAAGRVVEQALTLALIIGVVGSALLFGLAEPACRAMGASGEVLQPAVDYLRIRALAAPALLVVTTGHGVFRGQRDTLTALWVTLALNAVNLVLDPLLIFGLGWGLTGAAWATVAAQWTGAVLFLWLIFGPRREELGVELRIPAVRELGALLGVGSVLSLRTFALIGTMTVATAVAARLGVAQVAAHQVGIQLWTALALLVDALAVAGQALVASHLGAGDRRAAREVGDRLLWLGLWIGGALAAVVAIAQPLIPRAFDAGPEVGAALQQLLPIVVLMQPLNALVFVWDGLFLGLRDYRFVAGAMVASAAPAAVLLLLVRPLGLGLLGVWAALVLFMVARAATSAWRWAGARRRLLRSPDPTDPAPAAG